MVDDFSAAFIAVFFLHFEQLGLDNGQNFVLVRQNRLQPGNQCQQLVQLIFNSLALQPGQAAQLHSQDRLGLDLAQAKFSPQVCFGLLLRLRGADCFNYLINMVKGDLVAFQDMGASLGLFKLKLGPAAHHHLAVMDKFLQHIV